jgi:murein DD-endopeptidase MepM/ murein hydrolase activator NlpD
MLRGHGIAADAATAMIDAVSRVFDPRRLRSFQPFSLVRTFDGALRHFEYEIDAASFLRIVPDASAGTLRADVVPIPRTLELVSAAGAIDDETPSLFQAIEGAGETPELAVALAELFSGQLDFNTELQPGDRFAVSFERFTREGRAPTYGIITAAEFQNDGRVLRAFRYAPPGGKPAYYDEDGRSIRRFFLRSPLKFEPRITSGFSARRMHPVLHTARAHRGVDYGAPTGAQVLAVASGTVLGATYDRANGRMVRLRHASGYESYYLHLSAFAAGMRAGARVEQGQTIGRVGATGLATGPHLHFGLKKNGVFVNPLAEQRKLPPGDPIPAAHLEAFAAERDRALETLAAAISTRPGADVATVRNALRP